jgi:methyltransferase family protein
MIGVGPGVMALALKEGNPDVQLTVIDHDTCSWCGKHLEAAGLNHNVTYFTLDSVLVASEHSGHIDLLIVDGDHSYDGVMRDLVVWLPKVAESGFIFLHDYDARATAFQHVEQYPGVKQATNKYFKHQRDKYERVERVGTALIVRRKHG